MKKDSIATQEELLQFMTAVIRGEETEKLVTNVGYCRSSGINERQD